ncbi:MAG: hypothetical protein ABIF85_03635 [Nanoarchaeota archaeon]|nr:hypothetical protein [Nanoarchaeota archaeon]MBU4300944.1 hypothetical protein [Nanoarchaeota archaeon]MBU4452258.1 hypothetical protein [Nanoarchaeota archaeon]MCG2724528.1 hypothetical protein [archaeon]
MKQKYLLALAILGILLVSGCIGEKPKQVNASDIIDNPQSYDGKAVTLSGVVVRNVGNFFGPEYELAVFDNSKEFNVETADQIALIPKEGSSLLDLSRTVSYTFDGRNYSLIEYHAITFEGTIHYVGEASDSPPFYFEVEGILEV